MDLSRLKELMKRWDNNPSSLSDDELQVIYASLKQDRQSAARRAGERASKPRGASKPAATPNFFAALAAQAKQNETKTPETPKKD